MAVKKKSIAVFSLVCAMIFRLSRLPLRPLSGLQQQRLAGGGGDDGQQPRPSSRGDGNADGAGGGASVSGGGGGSAGNIARDAGGGAARRYNNNRTLVVIIGNLRGGERAWETLYGRVLDPSSADLALMIGYVDPSNRTSSLYSRARYAWTFPEYDDWGDVIDMVDNETDWRVTHLPLMQSDGFLGGMKGRRGSGAGAFSVAHRDVQPELQ